MPRSSRMSRALLLIGLPAQTALLGGLIAMIPLSIAMALSKESPGKSKSSFCSFSLLETAKTQYTEKQKGAEEAPAQEPQSPSAVTVMKFSNS